ncbi:MAG: type IV toxin-antitoxin system AbiEi family antitoxin domain-containing protein [Propionibacteriaceae bacterium]|jgi:predicted transcriptional regulator of viral defense system|nr:type IV toxin-antitoxin system AbiEi family antitoxin domain-containing protein [Propionibacteriaceae bacterium]
MLKEVVTYLDRLREIAIDQHGFVTLAQALDAGVPQPQIAQMAARGRLERVAHGVYRVPQVPETEYDQYALAVLWSGAPEACLSHDTALMAWDITDINPDRTHITVAKGRRLRRAGGSLYVIHHENLSSADLAWWQGIRVTNVPTAIRQCIETDVPTYLIRQALERAGRTSLLREADKQRLTEHLEVRDGNH